MRKLLLEIDKKERKKKKLSKIAKVDEPEASVQSQQAELEKFKQRKYIYQETDQLYLKILAYLHKSSKEDVSKCSRIKEKNEKIKFINEEARMLQQKHLKP